MEELPTLPKVSSKRLLSLVEPILERYRERRFIAALPEDFAANVVEALEQLTDTEKDLITRKYMQRSVPYDYGVYNQMEPCISKDTFTKTRHRAMVKKVYGFSFWRTLLPSITLEVYVMTENKEENDMAVTQIKPIRPTRATFYTEQEAQKFENYASQIKKTESVGMDRMREMMREFKEKRK
jgi:hypothetical protein